MRQKQVVVGNPAKDDPTLLFDQTDALFWGIGSIKDIDNAMTTGVNYPKGLLAWADEKGIDWCVSKMDEM